MKEKNIIMISSGEGLDIDLSLLAQDIQKVIIATEGKFNIRHNYDVEYNEDAFIMTREPIDEEYAEKIHNVYLRRHYEDLEILEEQKPLLSDIEHLFEEE